MNGYEFLPLAADLGLLSSENLLSEMCTKANISLKGLNAQAIPAFSFEEGYQPLLLAFQNVTN